MELILRIWSMSWLAVSALPRTRIKGKHAYFQVCFFRRFFFKQLIFKYVSFAYKRQRLPRTRIKGKLAILDSNYERKQGTLKLPDDNLMNSADDELSASSISDGSSD